MRILAIGGSLRRGSYKEFAVSEVHERFNADGRLSDDVIRARLGELLAELALATTDVVAAA
jgi:NAD(P)H-dependent FMN reductase